MKKLRIKSKFKETAVLIIMGLVLIYLTFFLKLENLTNFINKTLPPKEANLMAGMILGNKNNFDKSLTTDLKNSGLMHLVVISGANLMILMKFIIDRLAGIVNRKIAIIIGMLMTWTFVDLVGWQVSILRAVLMVSIIYWAQLLGRKFSTTRAIILVLILMIIIDYKFILEVSFWLSFTAYFGVITSKNKWNFWWVPLWTTPILGIYFGKISLVSPITNMLVIGVSEIVTILGLTGVVLGQVVTGLGSGILLITLPVLKYFLYITEIFGDFKMATLSINFNWMMLIGWYLVLSGYCLAKQNR